MNLVPIFCEPNISKSLRNRSWRRQLALLLLPASDIVTSTLYGSQFLPFTNCLTSNRLLTEIQRRPGISCPVFTPFVFSGAHDLRRSIRSFLIFSILRLNLLLSSPDTKQKVLKRRPECTCRLQNHNSFASHSANLLSILPLLR